MKKLIALLISITFITLPACSKSNIEQITGTATSTTEQTKEATQIVEEGKKEKENTYLSKIKSCWGWTWQNKKYIAGGAVVIGVLGLVVWRATKGEPVPKDKTDPEAEPPQENNEPIVEHNANNQPVIMRSNIDTFGPFECLVDFQSDDDDVDFPMFRAKGDRRIEIPSIESGGKPHWLIPVAPESEEELFERWERRMNSSLGVGHRHELEVNDRILLYGQQNKGRYMYGKDGHWWQVVYDDKEILPLNQDLSIPPVLESNQE